jgi:hypothetical protein
MVYNILTEGYVIFSQISVGVSKGKGRRENRNIVEEYVDIVKEIV